MNFELLKKYIFFFNSYQISNGIYSNQNVVQKNLFIAQKIIFVWFSCFHLQRFHCFEISASLMVSCGTMDKVGS